MLPTSVSRGCEPDQEIVNFLPSLLFPRIPILSCLIGQPSSMPQTLCHMGKVKDTEIGVSMPSEYWKYGEWLPLRWKLHTNCNKKRENVKSPILERIIVAHGGFWCLLGKIKKKVCHSITFINWPVPHHSHQQNGSWLTQNALNKHRASFPP